MSGPKRRKVDSECRVFNKEWTTKYFFTEVRSTAVCLICQEAVAVFKEYNISRHFATKHANYASRQLIYRVNRTWLNKSPSQIQVNWPTPQICPENCHNKTNSRLWCTGKKGRPTTLFPLKWWVFLLCYEKMHMESLEVRLLIKSNAHLRTAAVQ